MSRIKSKNTKPEILVRKYLFNKGLRFRLNGKISKKVFSKGFLPGKPDLVFKKYHTVLFVNGCFWHSHKGCKKSHLPKSNIEYWENKLKNNRLRDEKNYQKLRELGFRILVIWECEVDDTSKLEKIYKDIICAEEL